MGMLNAGSTTVGLLVCSHRFDIDRMKVVTLRSSDDSMTLYLADSPKNLSDCVQMNKVNLEIGINLSTSKTFLFREGFGEYTSWYMDGDCVSQYGVETSAIRPQGKNPPDDFNSIAKGTAVAMAALTCNPLGATSRLKLGILVVRRLWRTQQKQTNTQESVNMYTYYLMEAPMYGTVSTVI